VIALAVSPEALRRLYEGLDLGPKGFVGIRRLDDTLFLRWPDIMATGSRVPGCRRARRSRRATSAGSLDGIERIFSSQRCQRLSVLTRWSARRSTRCSTNTAASAGFISERAAFLTLLPCGSGRCCSPS